ncbi:pilus assembly protein [Ramlibacter sp. USB13]|uniref:Pilus assembly protein n=1 Tax=Ramlibacter cellulosilyticus TaxID=2764187 RepID=A0A923SAH8_9BURK|nr:TfpX/TfpZ family type IV pilin accessory protein [Ramlibacter cellulosilyticus]MBC5782801.1 pilus assembly protein [Ramlibacter cellulosilyticus]
MQQPSLSAEHHTAFAFKPRLRAAGIHLVLSVLVAIATALLVFSFWYPWPYNELSGGRELFRLVVAVDIVLGPLLTFIVFQRSKPRAELRRDLAVIVALQLAGLAYGLWTVHQARPVHLVFEYDRFRVVHQVDIPRELEAAVPPGIPLAPLGGPTPLVLRPFRDAAEQGEYTMAALQGLQVSMRPELWQPYEVGTARVLQAARPVSQLKQRFPQQGAAIDAALSQAGRDAAGTVYLPLIARQAVAWTVLLDAKSAEIVGYVPLDSF